MCGIAGVAGQPVDGTSLDRVGAMLAALARRGPDHEGMESWDDCVLGHRRLSIFDLSAAGHQPMCSPDGRVGVVFNGAIYNFRELRSDLAGSGSRFESATDTEVLVHGYRAWGIDGLVARIRGMFAFALWDDLERSLYLVRDRLGVKPLVYHERAGALAFASTVRALHRAGLADELDRFAVAEFLEFGYVTEERSIYEGVRKVPPATILHWCDGRLTERRYWAPPTPEADGPNFHEAVARTEELFLRAVERRLHADVPVGALLSGGVDSSLVCWAISSLGADVTAFTVAAPGDPWDESDDARATARRLGLRHEVIELSPTDDSILDELVEAYAEPFACASALGMLQVSRAVGGTARVLLTGDGGDDVFLGYPRHRHLRAAERIARRVPAPATAAWNRVRHLAPTAGPLKRVTNFVDYCTGGLGAFLAVHDGLPLFWRHGMLGDRLAGVSVEQRSIRPSLGSARNVLSEYLAHDRRTQFVSEYLVKVDGATMHHALEARSPFLDQEIWEYASHLPFDVRMHGGALKAILRELAQRKIGIAVARGRKRGFQIPVQRWLAGRWYDAARESLSAGRLADQGWIRPEAVNAVLRGSAANGFVPHQIWYLYVLERWLEHEHSRASAPTV